MKRCSVCGLIKPPEEFYRKNTADGYESACKPCCRARSKKSRDTHRSRETHRQQMAAWKVANPERYAEMRFVYRTRRFGMTPEGYRALLASQDGRCAACGSSDPQASHGQFGIDHDHSCCPGKKSCGKCVRGLLCNGCNTALAHVKDDPERLRQLIAYLERSKAHAIG